MSIKIRGAPAPGWYVPVGEHVNGMVPYLWTGVAKANGRKVEGRVVSVNKHDSGPQAAPQWVSAAKVRTLGDKKRYALVETPPTIWRDQDIRAAVASAEQTADEERRRSS
jgi:hypothetical protein